MKANSGRLADLSDSSLSRILDIFSAFYSQILIKIKARFTSEQSLIISNYHRVVIIAAATMDATTTAGKRKSDEVDTADTDANLFASLPDTTWEMISSFAAPPDVYNLSLSSKHFFREVSTDKPSEKKSPSANVAAKGNVGRRSKRLAAVAATASAATSETNAASSSNDKKVLATQLLRASLLSSLGRVLEQSGSGITLDAVLKMSELPEGSALIAGSTIVAACLGKDWSGGRNSSDVDVYCSARAAPQVRSVRDIILSHACCLFIYYFIEQFDRFVIFY